MHRLAALSLLAPLAVPTTAQDVTLVSQTGRVADDRADRAPALENPFESLDRFGHDHGFQNAGGREVRTIPGGRRRLIYTLSRSGEPTSLDRFAAAAPTFRDRWLIAELMARHDGLDRPELVDEAKRRSRGETSSTLVTRRLEVSGTTESVTAAERFLDAVVQQNRQMVNADVWIVRRRARDAAEREVRIGLLDEKALEKRIAGLTEEPADVLASPRVTVLGGQSAAISMTNQVSFLKDCRFEKVGDAVIADPEIGTAHEGLLIELTPILGPAGRTISIGAGVTIANLKRPIAEMTLRVPPSDAVDARPAGSGDGVEARVEEGGTSVPVATAVDDGEVRIQLPEIAVTTWSSEEIRLGEGDAGFQVAGLRETDWDANGDVAAYDLEVLARLRIVDPEELYARLKPAGEVLGFDPQTKRAFVRLNGEIDADGWTDRAVHFQRDDEVVAQGRVVDVDGVVAIVEVEEGAPRLGDLLVP